MLARAFSPCQPVDLAQFVTFLATIITSADALVYAPRHFAYTRI
jgi:hypothetical protein